jgi:hypothetical protein
MNPEAAGRQFLKRLPQERMLSGRSELAEIELRDYPTDRPPFSCADSGASLRPHRAGGRCAGPEVMAERLMAEPEKGLWA